MQKMMDLRNPRLINLYMDTLDSIAARITGRSLLAADTHSEGDACSGHETHDLEESFQHIYFAMLFMACLWFVGKGCARLGLPALVGEIIVGIILGPEFMNFVPYSDAFVVIGEIGLVLLVLEAGIDVSIGHLKVVGSRGLGVAVLGSLLPLGIGTGLAMMQGNEFLEAIAIGACLAPTSMGIALNVLRNAKVLNTPTGQLIIAAAVLDDVIALMLLSELEALADPTPFKILLPLIVSPAFILFFGYAAIKWTPWAIQGIMKRTSKNQHENVILLLVFISSFVMIPICYYAKSSHLLGAFLAGLMFCTDHTIHEAWSNQIKRIMQWMLRIFFACTIGFAVPIQDFWSTPVLTGAGLYFIAILGKVATGIFARPMSASEFFTISFSMSAWGEFAFILATASHGTGAMSDESYSSVLMAVLLSVIISPLCLRLNLSLAQRSRDSNMESARSKVKDDEEGEGVSVYFCVHTKGRGKWGHQDKLLHCIFALDLEIIDFRAFNEAEYNYSHHLPIVQDVFYVRDTTLSLPPTKRLGKKEEQILSKRHREIRKALMEAMADPHAKVDVMRWIPGVRRNDDVQSPRKPGQEGNRTKKKKKTASYCRKEAYRQARLALDTADAQRSSGYLVSGISRIRPTHDALYAKHFSYHGGIHTEEDDLIALQFVNTLDSLVVSLSPDPRRSPSGDNSEVLNHEELLAKVQTLSNFVHHMQAFQPALSDDGREELSAKLQTHEMQGLIKNLSVSSTHAGTYANGASANGQHTNGEMTFDNLYESTFTPNEYPESNGQHSNGQPLKRSSTAERGSMRNLIHSHSITNQNSTRSDGISRSPMPGLFASSSHGQLVSNARKRMGGSKFARDTYPQDVGGYYYPGGNHHGHVRLPSATNSVDGHSALHHSSTDSDSSSSSSNRIDTMYADEDRHHNPLYSALGDVNEDPREGDEEEDPDDTNGHHTTGTKEDHEKPPAMKRSGTWSKLSNLVKPKRLSDDEEEDAGARTPKRKRKKNKKAKKQKHRDNASNGQHHPDESSSESHPAPKRKGKLSRSHNELQPMRGAGDDDERSPLKH